VGGNGAAPFQQVVAAHHATASLYLLFCYFLLFVHAAPIAASTAYAGLLSACTLLWVLKKTHIRARKSVCFRDLSSRGLSLQ